MCVCLDLCLFWGGDWGGQREVLGMANTIKRRGEDPTGYTELKTNGKQKYSVCPLLGLLRLHGRNAPAEVLKGLIHQLGELSELFDFLQGHLLLWARDKEFSDKTKQTSSYVLCCFLFFFSKKKGGKRKQ